MPADFTAVWARDIPHLMYACAAVANPREHPSFEDFRPSWLCPLLTCRSCAPSQPGQHGRGHIPESSRTPDEWIAIFQKKGLYYLPQMSQKLKKAAYAIWSHRENIFAMGVSPDLDNDSPVDSRVHWNRQEESLV